MQILRIKYKNIPPFSSLNIHTLNKFSFEHLDLSNLMTRILSNLMTRILVWILKHNQTSLCLLFLSVISISGTFFGR